MRMSRCARSSVFFAAFSGGVISTGCGGAATSSEVKTDITLDASIFDEGVGVVVDDASVSDALLATDTTFPDDTADVSATDAAETSVVSDAFPIGGTAIEHVVIIVQENHTFDAYFGRYCTATTGSNPTCTTGPACCEAAPATDPSGASPVALDDSANANYDPNHGSSCEAPEMDDGKMDHYVTGASCSNAGNFALATTAVAVYTDWAKTYAIADRYFQPLIGESSANDMYLATAHWVFDDDSQGPSSNGHGCITIPEWDDITYTGDTTLGDILIADQPSPKTRFGFYAEGYAAMLASSTCPSPPSGCTMTPFALPTNPCDYDPSDVPFEYYAQFKDNPDYMLDAGDFTDALEAGTLRSVSFLKPVGYHNEHPGYGTQISVGSAYVKGMVDKILGSERYAGNTLILVTWDEGGGFFDHVAPPGVSPIDGKSYGTRIPLLALGRFAKQNYVSHVTMEHSSIVKFLEWNFLGGVTGQLGARDTIVNGIGDLLDPTEVGAVVP